MGQTTDQQDEKIIGIHQAGSVGDDASRSQCVKSSEVEYLSERFYTNMVHVQRLGTEDTVVGNIIFMVTEIQVLGPV